MKITKKELANMVREIIEESVITSKDNEEMYNLLSEIARLKNKVDKKEEELKELKTEFSNKQKEVKKFLKKLDDKIAETNDVVVELEEIIKYAKQPSYVTMAKKLYEELNSDLKGFDDMAKTFISKTPKKSYELKTKVKQGRRAKEESYRRHRRVIEEGKLMDSIIDFGTIVKKNINKLGEKIKEWTSLLKKHDKTMDKAKNLIKKANVSSK